MFYPSRFGQGSSNSDIARERNQFEQHRRIAQREFAKAREQRRQRAGEGA